MELTVLQSLVYVHTVHYYRRGQTTPNGSLLEQYWSTICLMEQIDPEFFDPEIDRSKRCLRH
jgi:hypothetical protein